MPKFLYPILLLVFFGGLPISAGFALQQPAEQTEETTEDPAAALRAARDQATAARERYDSLVRLSASGSASQWDVQQSNYQRKIALLRFGILDRPLKKDEYELQIAELIAEFATKRVEIYRKMARSRGISKLDFRRLETSRDIARLRVEGLKDQERSNFYSFKIAVAEYELAQTEYDAYSRLYRKGSISKARFESAKTERQNAKSKLDERKKKLGARAKVLNLKT